MMQQQDSSYADILRHSRRANFDLDEVLGEDQTFDFARPFMPEALARCDELPFLSQDERLLWNQIRAHTYLSMFALVEEFILPFLLDHARARLDRSDAEVRALLQFAGEEAKHIELFRRFHRAFRAGFGSECEVIGPAEQIGKVILSHDPLSVALVILMIEWMTQAHYLESVREERGLEPCFKELLRCHWMEESQHAKLDTLIVEALAERYGPEEREKALDGFFSIGGFIADGLRQQVELDMAALERKLGRALGHAERARLRDSQVRANYFTYLGSGMVHPRFQSTLAKLGGKLLARVHEAAPAFR